MSTRGHTAERERDIRIEKRDREGVGVGKEKEGGCSVVGEGEEKSIHEAPENHATNETETESWWCAGRSRGGSRRW